MFSIDQVRTWPGKKVVCVCPENESSPTRRKQLEKGKEYYVKSVSVGNYDAFIRLEGFPDEIYSEYSRRMVPNSFNAKAFILS